MLNIKKINDNKIKIIYNTINGVKEEIKDYPVLKVKTDTSGDYKDLTGTEYNLITNTNNNENNILAYTCLKNKYNKIDYFLNTVLQLENKFIKDLVSPELIFYDIETDSTDPETSKITSIAWIDKENKEYCYVRGVDGTETEIIQKFLHYCKNNKVMGLVGHNSFEFDNKVMIRRCKALKISDYSIFYYDCNLDTMILSNFLQYTPDKMISLNNLAKLLKIDDSKTDTGIYNPITLYYEALEDDNKLELFKEYNIQDVHLCKACFEAMNSLEQLEELFKQTLCPFKKLSYNQSLLNSFTCKYLYSNNIVVPESVNTPVKFENKGGYNYYKESEQLDIHKKVLVLDIVSYYPHLLMLIGADPTNEYKNVDRTTGTINKFEDNLTDGILGQLSKLLYESRARIKKEMNQTTDPKLKEQLNHEQQAKKIIVNSLYGVLSQKNGYYVLKNELLGATITTLGRDLLKNIIENFNVVYAKTDSVFIPLKEDDKPEIILNHLNIYINKFFKEKYNLENTTSNGQLVRFERDSILDYLIIKDKNNYVKINNGEFSFKGGSFTNAKMSTFENELTNNVLNELLKNNIDIVDNAIKFTEQQLQNQDLNYFSKLVKLSKKQENNKIMKGRVFMEDNNISYTFGFKYLSCRVEHPEYDYILYPPEYNPDLTIKHEYVYELLCKQLKNIKIINHEKYNKLFKRFKNSNNQIKITDKTKPVKTVKNKQFKNIKNKYIKKLNELIPDTAEYYNKGLLGLIPVKAKSKEAFIKGFSLKSESELDKFNISEKIKKNDNFGLVMGYKGLCCLDIDGARGILKDEKGNELIEENNKLKEYLKNILLNIDYPFIIQKSQSGGYHLLYYSNSDYNFDLKNIYYPDDFYIESLRGKSLHETGAIDIFQKQNHYIVFAPSQINKTHKYELLDDNYTWKNIFNNEIKDIRKPLDKAFKEAGFTVKERNYETKKEKTKNISNTIKNQVELKELNNDEILKVTENVNNILKEADKSNCKHYVSLALGGYFSKHITEKSANKICNNVVSEIGNLMKNTGLFMQTVLNNYNNPIEQKTGIPTIRDELLPDNETVEKALKEILNIIEPVLTIKEIKEQQKKKQNLINTNKSENVENNNIESTEIKDIEEYEDKELYNLNKDSWISLEDHIKYNISKGFLEAIKPELEKLYKLCKDFSYCPCPKCPNPHTLTLSEILCGGLCNYGLTNDNIRKILKNSEIDDFKKYSDNKDKDLIVVLGGKVHGFKTLISESELTDDNKETLKKLIGKKTGTIIKLLYKATKLNPYFYITGENNEYKQDKKEFKVNNITYLNCAFKEIIEHTPVGITENVILSKKYDFIITLKNGQNKKLENYTKKDLEKYLKENNLLMNKPDNTIFIALRGFINEVKNKRKTDIKQVKKAYVTGFVVKEIKENHYKLFDNFPDLNENIINKYTLEDGIELLNTIYTEVFNEDMRFIKVFKWYLVHSLREIFKEFNLFNSVLYQLVLYGYGGTGKTLVLLILSQMFTSKILIENVTEADTIASVDRVIGKSTLPLILDDPVTPLKDYDRISKKYNFGIHTRAKAKEQYGNEVNITPVTRQTVLVVNDSVIDNSDTGLARRRYFLSYTKADIFLDSAKDKLRQITYTFGSNKNILKLNTIGINYIQYLSEYINSLNLDNYVEEFDKLSKSKGAYIVNNFIEYCNNKSDIKFHKDFLNEDSYIFESIETDYQTLFYERFIYHIRNGNTDINITEYDENYLNQMLNNIPNIIKKEYNKNDKEYKIVIIWSGLKQFIESSAGLKIKLKPEELCELLEIPETHKFKKGLLKEEEKNGMLLMKMSINDFYYYYLNSYI